MYTKEAVRSNCLPKTTVYDIIQLFKYLCTCYTQYRIKYMQTTQRKVGKKNFKTSQKKKEAHATCLFYFFFT